MNGKPRLLFVDDEPAIRVTLPAILVKEGFEVRVAATVPEALQIITCETFEILLTDLNIGNPGDGFTVVSAMRRTQPSAVTLILTGYPDFQTALEAIRQQVDDYLTKPADVQQLVELLKTKLQNPRRVRSIPAKPVATVIKENAERIVADWLAQANVHAELGVVQISDRQRINQLPFIIDALSKTLESATNHPAEDALEAAMRHGASRAEQGFKVTMLVQEAGILHNVLSRVLQDCLLEIDMSTLVSDVMKIGENLNALLTESVRAFQQSTANAA
ncbi:MAG TPA: response regulator [Candidatus Angelobacter sp.]|nr:response regulator [Candidatus Angelobacter sp.]